MFHFFFCADYFLIRRQSQRTLRELLAQRVESSLTNQIGTVIGVSTRRLCLSPPLVLLCHKYELLFVVFVVNADASSNNRNAAVHKWQPACCHMSWMVHFSFCHHAFFSDIATFFARAALVLCEYPSVQRTKNSPKFNLNCGWRDHVLTTSLTTLLSVP